MENTYNLLKPALRTNFLNGLELTKKNFLPLLLIVLVCCIAGTPTSMLNQQTVDKQSASRALLGFITSAYWMLFLPVISYSANRLYIKIMRNEVFDIKEIVLGFNNYLNIILANLLTTALVGISFIALIIPGIIVGCRLSFVSYLVMDKGLDPIAAIEESWRITKGHTWKIFLLWLTSLFVFILGIVCLIVGILPALMWISATFASFYQALLNEQDESAEGLSVGELSE